MATDFLPLILPTNPLDEQSKTALSILSNWRGEMVDGAPALIFNAWMRELNRQIYQDETGDNFKSLWRMRPLFIQNVLENKNGQARWCNNINTNLQESCLEILSLSLQLALQDTAARFGQDMSAWKWAEVHFAHSDHRPFSKVSVLKNLFDIKVPSIGGNYTVNVGRNKFSDEAQPFANYHAASLRAIYDLSDLDNSIFMHSTGQSGNILSDHYRDMAEGWSKMEYISMSTNPADYNNGAIR